MILHWNKIKKLPGWLSYVDALIIQRLCEIVERERGDVVVSEIGVHHGKSFIHIIKCFTKTVHSIAVDIFAEQVKNIDRSGKGDRERFLINLQNNGLDRKNITIIQKSSLDIQASDITGPYGNCDVFHVDGAHYYKAVMNDLKLADECLSEKGVIIIDDIWRPEWPDVTKALYDFLAETQDKYSVIAFGYNKAYLARKECADRYRNHMKQCVNLKALIFSKVNFCDVSTPVYRSFPNSEWGLRRKIKFIFVTFFTPIYLKIYHILK